MEKEEKAEKKVSKKEKSPRTLIILKNFVIMLFLVVIILLFIVIWLMIKMDGVHYEMVSDELSSDTDDVEEVIYNQSMSITSSSLMDVYSATLSKYTDDDVVYGIVDVNSDGIMELIVKDDDEFYVYTYDENVDAYSDYVVLVGMFSSENATLYKMNNDSLMIMVVGDTSTEVSYYTLDEDWLVRTSVVLSSTIQGDEEISLVPISDTSLLDNYR